MQKDFITVTPDSGSGSKEITVKASKTDTAKERVSTIIISGGDITRTIDVKQTGGTFGSDTKIEYNSIEFPYYEEIDRIKDVGKKIRETQFKAYFEGSFNGAKIEKKDISTDSNLSFELSEGSNMKGEMYEEFLRCFEVKRVGNKLELWYKKQISSSIYQKGASFDVYAFLIYSIYGGQFKYGLNEDNGFPLGLLVKILN